MSRSIRSELLKDLLPRQQENVRGGWWGRLGTILGGPTVGTKIGSQAGGGGPSESEESA